MSVRVEVICINAAGAEQRHQVLSIERAELAMETLGMSLDEGKALLAAVQDIVVAHQVQGDWSAVVHAHIAAPDIPARIPAAHR